MIKEEFIKKLYASFKKYYSFLYEGVYAEPEQKIFTDIGDMILRDESMNDIIKAFCEYRKDFISSDREAAAFALAIYEYDVETNKQRIAKQTI